MLLLVAVSSAVLRTLMGLAMQTTSVAAADLPDASPALFDKANRIVVTDQAMGARSAVTADFDGDGLMDVVSASSNDNAVSWFRNEGLVPGLERPTVSFSIKRQITWSSLGSRIVTTADLDSDGDVDVIGASYYDSSLRWFENDGTGEFTEHLISRAVNEGQGVTVADLDNDGDNDVATASSGDNTIAVFKNIANGTFCEIKEVVDDDAIGARTVIAADLNGDGWIDLASASKDDDSVAWYPNDGTGHFPKKIVISRGEESTGAYSLVAADVDKDGDEDLIVASNGNDHVSLWRNDGNGTFTKTLIYANADFVLSVTAVDFDRDGDIDVASASFFDGHINWYENVDGAGYEWKNHTIYVGTQGHYVSHADIDGDGDDDLIAVTHAENTVAVFLARTGCDLDGAASEVGAAQTRECCHIGTSWNGTSCNPCPRGTYGVGTGVNATCAECPTGCTVPGHYVIPATCSGFTGCSDAALTVAKCTCPENSVKNPATDACTACPKGQVRPDFGALVRGPDTIGNYTAWEVSQGVCRLPKSEQELNQLGSVVLVGWTLMSIAFGMSLFFSGWTCVNRRVRIVRASQPFFLIMICVGTAVMSATIIPIGIDDKNFSERACDVACMIAPWLFCIGFTIAFSALFSKLWRLNQVMKCKFRKIKVSERDVLMPFGVLLALTVIVLFVWTVVDPLRWSRQPVKDGRNWETYGTCTSQGVASVICAILLALIVLGALVLACVQAYMARAIGDEFSESKFIGIVVICWLQVLVVGVPLLFLVETNPTASYFLKTALIFVVSTSLPLLVFVPKMVQKNKKSKPMKSVSIFGVDIRRNSISRLVSFGNSVNGSFSSTGEMSALDTFGNEEQSKHLSVGEMGMRIISPQFEIDDLKCKIKKLQIENCDLKRRNNVLEELYQNDDDPLEENDVENGDTQRNTITTKVIFSELGKGGEYDQDVEGNT